MRLLSLLLASAAIADRGAHCFSSLGFTRSCRGCGIRHQSATVVTNAEKNKPPSSLTTQKLAYSNLIGSAFLIGFLVLGGGPVLADEIGVEKEAPTVFTGESVMVRAESPTTVRLGNSLR